MCDHVHFIEHGEHASTSQVVAKGQGSFRIVQAELNRGVDVDWGRNAQLGDTRADVDDHGKNALHDESGAVIDRGHGCIAN
jgi:hypothetical protein